MQVINQRCISVGDEKCQELYQERELQQAAAVQAAGAPRWPRLSPQLPLGGYRYLPDA